MFRILASKKQYIVLVIFFFIIFERAQLYFEEAPKR